jgi:glycosyltransferase involved in cell wall biosynthesis
MKILYITQLLPYPLDTGGKIKTFNTLQALAKKHQLHLICFVSKKEDLRHKKNLEKICSQVKVFVWPLTTLGFKELIIPVFFNFFSLSPFIFYRYFNPQMKNYVVELLKKEKFDAIHIDHFNMMQYLPKKKSCLWVFEEHNIESQGKWTIAQYERFPINIIFFWEAIRLWLKELICLRRFDFILAISSKDRKNIIKKGIKKEKALFLPMVIKTKSQFIWGYKNLLFIGLLSWWPNKDALIWFVSHIYSRLKEKIRGLKFYIVGAQPSPKLSRLIKKDKSIVLTGYVPDIKPYLKKAGCFVVPFRMGSGLRIKVLTTMATGIPVIGTKKGFEGLQTKNKAKDLLITNNKEKMIDYMAKVLNNKKFALSVSEKQLDLIKNFYSQEKQGQILDKVYKGK